MKIPLKKNKFLIWAFVFVLFIASLNIFQKEVKNFFYWFSFPIQEKFWSVGDKTSDFFEGLLKIVSLKEELDLLKQERQDFIVKLNQIEKLEKENEALRQALNIDLEEGLELSLAYIIAKSSSEDLIFINKGSEDGLLEGMLVITNQKVLIGKLNQVYKNYSAVDLISNKNLSFDIKIQGEKEVSAIANGNGNLSILLDLIPKEENIKEGDAVFTSSLGGAFPDFLLIGRVKKIIKKDAESFQKAEVESAFDLKELNHLLIITNFNHD